VQGGLVQLYQGWTPVSEVAKEGRWEPSELAGRMSELFRDRPTVYSPARSPLRQFAGIAGPAEPAEEKPAGGPEDGA
jgi:hypothetical protein